MKIKFFSTVVLAVSVLSSNVYANYQLTCKTVPELFRAYLTQHIVHKSLTPELHARTMDQYVKQMDPTKMVLLEGDVVEVKKHIQKLFVGLSKGDCKALDELQTLLLKRVQENEEIVRKILADEKFKIDESIELTLNPDKRKYAKTLEERAEMIRRSVHFQIWNYVSTDVEMKEAKQKLIHRYELNTKRIRERKPSDLLVTFIDAFNGALDPHTSYFSKERLDDFRIDMSLSLEGIGASLARGMAIPLSKKSSLAVPPTKPRS